jgi:hypothetical protein
MIRIPTLTLGSALLVTEEPHGSTAMASEHVDSICVARSLVTKVIKRAVDFLNSYLNSLLL